MRREGSESAGCSSPGPARKPPRVDNHPQLALGLLLERLGLEVESEPLDRGLIDAALDSAFNKADAKAVAAAYLPNAKLLPPTHEVISGPAEIENFFAGLFTSGFTDHNLTIIDAGGDDGVVYRAANWSAKATEPMGTIKPPEAPPLTCLNARPTDR